MKGEQERVEQLLKPRYKVIADYPGVLYEIGTIIPFEFGVSALGDILRYGRYPHLFKKLEWWEDRKPEEMPEYVKLLNGSVFKCSNWRKENGYLIFNVDSYISKRNQRADDYYQPATKEQYELYQRRVPLPIKK